MSSVQLSAGEMAAAPTHAHAWSSDRLWRDRTLMLVGFVLVIRTLYALLTPLDLIHDEAYYWDWSRRLDWGYYSKPPMIAWIMAASTSLLGVSTFAVRLPAAILGSLGLLWVYLLGARIYSPRAGFWAVAVSAATPGVTVMSLLMTIDAPFLFFWSATLYLFWRALEGGRGSGHWLALSAVTAGLGALSKQTMLGFLPLAGVFLLLSRRDRSQLLRPGIYLWAGGTLAFLTPVLWWNAANGWITLQHTSEHFAAPGVTIVRRLIWAGEFLAGQMGVVSPILWIQAATLMVAGSVALARRGRRDEQAEEKAQDEDHRRTPGRAELYLLCFSALPLAGVIALSFKQRIEPNWPAAFYPAAFVLLAGWASGHFRTPGVADRWRRWFTPGVALALLCSVAAYSLPYALPAMNLHGRPFDPTGRLRGWSDLGAEVEAVVDRFPERQRTFILSAHGRALAAELAFYMPSHPRTFCWNDTDHIRSQYDLWPGPESRALWHAAIVAPLDRPLPESLVRRFEELEPRDEVIIELGNGRRLAYRVWRGVAFQPAPGEISNDN